VCGLVSQIRSPLLWQPVAGGMNGEVYSLAEYQGDLIAGVLGERRALHGYSGVIPERVAPGDILHLLNLGGVIGTWLIASLTAAQGGWSTVFTTGAVTSVAAAFLWLMVDAGRGERK